MREVLDREKIKQLFLPFDNSVFPMRNRFVRAATYLAACDAESGRATPAAISRQVETAEGGAATVISEYAYVSREGKAARRQWGLDCDEAIGEVRQLADAIHGVNSKLVVQICHAGGARSSEIAGGYTTYTPSGGMYPGGDAPTQAMTEEDIQKVCRDYASAALRAKKGGADGVEIHAAHGYLLTEFLSPIINRREDRYGGSFENRLRITREVYAAVRAAVGDDYPVWIKMSVTEGAKDGYSSDEGIEAALMLLNDGVNVFEVSSGTSYAEAKHVASVVGVTAGKSEAPFAPYAAKIRARAPKDKLVLLTGGLRSVPVIAALMEDRVADIFGLCRPFNAEPNIVNRWAEDDTRPSACISCNACFKTAEYGVINCPITRKHK